MLVRLAMIAMFLLAVSGVALADTGAVAVNLSPVAMLVLLGCTVASYALRRYTSAGGFLHTPAGALLLAGVSAALSSIIMVIQTQGLNTAAIIQAVFAALMSLLGSANPSVAAAERPASKTPPAALVLALCLPIGMAGCACFKPASPQYNSKACVVARQAVDCTKGSVVQLILTAGPALAVALLTGAPIDLQALAAAAEKGGVGNGVCLLTAIQTDLVQPAGFAPGSPKVASARLVVDAAAHPLIERLYGAGPVDVKLPRPDGTVMVVGVQ